MGDTGGVFRKKGRSVRFTRAHQAPGIDKDLAAYLFGNSTAVLPDAAALGSRDPMIKVEVGGVFCRIAVAAPPEKAVLIRSVIKQGVSYVLRLQACPLAAVLQGPQVKQGPVAVIVRRKIFIGNRIAPELAVDIADLLIGPPFHRGSQPDADDLAQPAGIDLFDIVFFHNFAS